MKRSLLALAAVSALTLSAFGAEEYKFDTNHTSVSFTVRHLLISTVPGRFKDVTGTIALDEKDMTRSSVTAVIRTASIDTNNPTRDNDLRSANFFEVEKYPEATFKSRRIEKRGDQWVAIGDLTIKDVTKEVELPFDFNKITTPRGPIVGATISIKINRKDYHINYNRLMDNGGAVVSDDVKLELSVEAKPAAAAPATPPPAEPKK